MGGRQLIELDRSCAVWGCSHVDGVDVAKEERKQ